VSIEALQQSAISELLESRPLLLESDRVSKAIGYLRESNEYEVFVKRRKIAVATVRDLISVKNPQTSRLENIACYIPELKQNENLGTAARLMFDYRLRALPSYEDDGRVQIVSARGITRKIGSAKIHANASDIMTPRPITVQTEDAALKARQMMIRRSIDHLPVMRNGKLSGILTSSHILFNLLPETRVPSRSGVVSSGITKEVRFDYPVSRIADDSVLYVEPDAGISKVIDLILQHDSSYVLVVLWGELQGIITLRDIVKLLVKREESKVPFYIVGLPDEPFEAETAKIKFERTARSLSMAFPLIQEVRAIIKRKESGGQKRRYEVHVNLYTPREVYSYVEEGYDLADVFDKITPKLKRLLSSRQSRVTRTQGESPRKIE
jgi:CBS domain-containing protein